MAKIKPDETWLSKPAAAQRLGISERTLDRLITDGKIAQGIQNK